MPQTVNGKAESWVEESPVMVSVSLLGYILSFLGWFLFGCGVLGLPFEVSLAQKSYVSGAEACIINASYWIVPGWFLMRFGAGLFPFSMRFSKPAKEALT